MGDFRSWRGYFYIGLGVAFAVYRVVKTEQWTLWEYIDMLIAAGMITIGVYLIMKKG